MCPEHITSRLRVLTDPMSGIGGGAYLKRPRGGGYRVLPQFGEERKISKELRLKIGQI